MFTAIKQFINVINRSNDLGDVLRIAEYDVTTQLAFVDNVAV